MPKTKAKPSGSSKKSVKIPVTSMECSAENAFYLHDGRLVNKITDLLLAIKETDDSIFYYHVTSERNDFAVWINDVFKLKSLSNKLMKIKDKSIFISQLEKEIQ
ncbi:MAG: hypothetical protein OEZ13_08530 [Spirochaetia bacterium]|nr:hypothetical protein [Spirochaetia bacterium]